MEARKLVIPFNRDVQVGALLNCEPCLDLGQPCFGIPGRVGARSRNLDQQPLDPGFARKELAPRNDGSKSYVSTSPVLEPLASESLWP
jgi:hypothetical protein